MQVAAGRGALVRMIVCLAVLAWAPLTATGQHGQSDVVRFKIPIWDVDEQPDLWYPVFAIAPDGRSVVFVARRRLYFRRLAELSSQPIPRTEGAHSPFFSPDGRWVAFFTDRALNKVSLESGERATIVPVNGGRSGTWGDDGTIVYSGARPSGLWRVPVAGGDPTPLTRLGATDFDHVWPQFLPGARAVLFTALTDSTPWGSPQNFVIVLETGERRNLFPREDLRALGGNMLGTPFVRYVDTGHLIYGKSGGLSVVPFDADALQIPGGLATVRALEDRPVIDGVMMPGRGTFTSGFFTKGSVGARVPQFDVSRSGTLVYLPGVSIRRDLVWVDRHGREQPVGVEPRSYFAPRLSPDGKRIAVTFQQDVAEIWVLDIATLEWNRVAADLVSLWCPDGDHLIYGTQTLYRTPSTGFGSIEILSESDNVRLPNSISPDGTRIVFEEEHLEAGGDFDIGMLELGGQEATIISGPGLQLRPAISPDGRWIAYDSNESGQVEVYVRPFPDTRAGVWRISLDGGARPVWRSDGRELFYRNREAMVAVSVATEPTFKAGTPRVLFRGPRYYFRSARHYDVTPDGSRFLMIKDEPDGVPDQVPRELIVVMNWFDDLLQTVGDRDANPGSPLH